MRPISRIVRSKGYRRAVDIYLGGVPDPDWTPTLKFSTGWMALPGERWLYQRVRGQWPST